jgi:putative transposase
LNTKNYAPKGSPLFTYFRDQFHFHAIVSAKENHNLSNIIRDLKKFTAKELIRLIEEIPESRRVWLLNRFAFEANKTKRGQDYILWQEGYQGKQIISNSFLDQKLEYIHQNPLKEGWVAEPEHYLYSSASNYAGELSLIEVELLV